MSTKFEIGDVVCLKSGGEKMTVEKIDGEAISCVWTNKSGTQVRDTFRPLTLRKAQTAEQISAAMATITDLNS